ncbi:MAG: six-cysteine ranthipeptide SCIFF [Oscillospiraceae bacterium]|nr:six-cysteine ranthipeptide SCIFF [Oscillospiraceae bacterium]
MKHIKVISGAALKKSIREGGCGACQTSCQSACKTSCTVGNQKCENPRQSKKSLPLAK